MSHRWKAREFQDLATGHVARAEGEFRKSDAVTMGSQRAIGVDYHFGCETEGWTKGGPFDVERFQESLCANRCIALLE